MPNALIGTAASTAKRKAREKPDLMRPVSPAPWSAATVGDTMLPIDSTAEAKPATTANATE